MVVILNIIILDYCGSSMWQATLGFHCLWHHIRDTYLHGLWFCIHIMSYPGRHSVHSWGHLVSTNGEYCEEWSLASNMLAVGACRPLSVGIHLGHTVAVDGFQITSVQVSSRETRLAFTSFESRHALSETPIVQCVMKSSHSDVGINSLEQLRLSQPVVAQAAEQTGKFNWSIRRIQHQRPRFWPSISQNGEYY